VSAKSESFHSFSQTLFLSGGSRGTSPIGGPEIPRGFQQHLIVLLASHQDGTKQGRRCNHATWALADI